MKKKHSNSKEGILPYANEGSCTENKKQLNLSTREYIQRFLRKHYLFSASDGAYMEHSFDKETLELSVYGETINLDDIMFDIQNGVDDPLLWDYLEEREDKKVKSLEVFVRSLEN